MTRLSGTRFSHATTAGLLAFVVLAAGCQPQQAFYLTSKGQAQRQYIDKAMKISYPDVNVPTVSEVCSREPLTLDNPNPTDYWDLSLEDVMRMALTNSKVIRTLNGVNYSTAGAMGVPGMLTGSPQAVGTVYDPALTESNPLYGVEAALSVFDAQLKTAATWQKSDRPTYVNETTNSYQQSDTGTFQATIQKLNATGGNTYMTHANTYSTSRGAIPGLNFPVGTPPNWGSYLEAGFSQPLLQGAGLQFNRIAGPSSSPGSYQGAVIARINSDISLVDFEMAVRGLVADTETAYWNLYYAYHYLQSVKAGRDAALRTWQQTYSMYINEHPRGRAQYEAQSRQSYYQLKSQTEIAQSNLFKSESMMRYIMGLAVSDGRLIRPSDEPIIAPVRLDWNSVVCESLSRSPELRKQKWDVKAKELQLTASKNFLMPRVDLNGSYRWQGVGKWIVDPSGANTSGYGSLADNRYADWTLGLSATMPFGWRRELAGVRNAQLSLSRSRSILQEQELEMTHQLADAFRTLSQTYTLSQTHYQRRIAAEAEVRAVQATYDVGTTTLDQLLAAQQKLAEAETTYYRSVVDYNLALTTLHYRKGSLLEYNGVYLSEGPWPNKAYFDATRQARKRDAGAQINYGFTRPRVVSRNAYQQWQPQHNSISGDTIDTKSVPTVAPVKSTSTPIQPPAAPTPAVPSAKTTPTLLAPSAAMSVSETTMPLSPLVSAPLPPTPMRTAPKVAVPVVRATSEIAPASSVQTSSSWTADSPIRVASVTFQPGTANVTMVSGTHEATPTSGGDKSRRYVDSLLR